jgi:PTH2 family peptidyl-tRNA hydrolase
MFGRALRRFASTDPSSPPLRARKPKQPPRVPAPAPAGGEPRLALLLRSDLGMSKGKLCAQAAHAAVSAFRAASVGSDAQRAALRAWLRSGQAKVVLRVEGEAALAALQGAGRERGLPAVSVHDAGRTQVEAGSLTCVALGPGSGDDVAALTGHLKLL